MLRNTPKAAKIKSRGILINLALLITSTVFALLLSEVALRLIGWGPLYVSPERAAFWKYDSVLGWANQPGQEGIFETAQFRTTVHINQKGLRDREHSYARPNGTKRILVLGDSFAWGYGVEESERFSQLLETSLPVEVINAGVSGYSTDQELLWYRNEGIKYEVDLVILTLAGRDVGDNSQQLVFSIYYKPKFVSDAGQLVLTGVPVPRVSPEAKFVNSLSQESAVAFFLLRRYFDLLSTYHNLKYKSDSANPSVSGTGSASQPFGLTVALIDEMRNIAASKNAKFMIVATPRWWNAPAGQTYKGFIGILQAKGLSVLDVESMPGFDPGKMNIPNDGHWSKAGHEFVAEKIKNVIERDQLLSRPQNQSSIDYGPRPISGPMTLAPGAAGVGAR